MKNILATATAFLGVSLLLAPLAHAHETARHHRVERHRIERHHYSRRSTRKETIPGHAVKWGCDDEEALYIVGNPQSDANITVYFERQHHILNRISTTTGAQRYQDKLSGWDLIVIPTKGMLMNDRLYSRLADDCVPQQTAPAATRK